MDLADFTDFTDYLFDVIDYKGLYKINQKGDVYCIKRKKLLKHTLVNGGYYMVSLCKNGKYKKFLLHRLIAINFISNDDETKIVVDHIDGNINNNNSNNLRWVTKIDNDRNKISKIIPFIRKGSGTITYRANYSIYIDDKRIHKSKQSTDYNIVEDWFEQMKKDYPNKYTAGRI
jgi:hypothetical protein